ncbi:MAG TPA: hypothetical protein VIF39_06765, partial [Hyphomicrobium sp.]
MTRVFKFDQKWPDHFDGNEYWIAVDPFVSYTQHGRGLILGRECKSLAELENLSKDLHADLDR